MAAISQASTYGLGFVFVCANDRALGQISEIIVYQIVFVIIGVCYVAYSEETMA